MSRLEVHVGDRYGRLEVLEELERHVTPNGTIVRMMRCRCDCGGEVVVGLGRLRNGGTRSCGCLVGQGGVTHGATGTPEYRTWLGIRARCSDASNHNYGGRGIRVCARWQESFEAFLEDMGRRPSDEHSIDRIETNGNYEPGNCRWATAQEQSRNMRVNVMVTHNGETLCVAEWAERYGISCSMLNSRLRAGWDFEKAVSSPAWCDSSSKWMPISKRTPEWYREYARRQEESAC
jgi:hypothetical protein